MYKKRLSYYIDYITKIPYNLFLSIKLAKYGKNSTFFEPPAANGDYLCFLLCLKEYMESDKNKIIILNKKESLKSLIELFNYQNLYIADCDKAKYKSKMHPKVRDLYREVYRCKEQKSMLDAFMTVLNISDYKKLYYPRITPKENITPDTVFIVPDAVSTGANIEDKEWTELADKLTEIGYQVVINCNDEKRFNRFKNVFYDIQKTLELCNTVKYVVGNRSGLMDCVGALCSCNQVVIFPENLGWYASQGRDYSNCLGENDNEKAMNFYSINKMFDNGAIEFIYQKGKLAEKVLSIIT